MNGEVEKESGKTADMIPSKSKKLERIFRRLFFLPYFLGIAWTCLNPVVSILTGELKCRGWYLDEHSIEIKFADNSSRDIPSHLKVSLPSKPLAQNNMCDALATKNNLSCHVHGEHFSMATVTPLANALDPVEEALVFLMPAPPMEDWTATLLHYTLLTSLGNLADPMSTPWLAKTLIFVVPNGNSSLEDAVSSFLDAYMGCPSQQTQKQLSVPPLPPSLSGALLRSLVVLDVDDKSSKSVAARGQIPVDQLGRTEFAILPQGRRGVLPNMDLVFLVGKLFTKAMFLSTQKFPRSSFLVHDYANESRAISTFLSEQTFVGPLDKKTMRWSQDLANMGLFAYNMVMGPYPPHAVALDRGIDSITIKAKFEGEYHRDPSAETIQFVEYLIRALSNLHERLHHSHTLYLLPTPRTFVSHIEYFLPNILVLLPLAVRGFGLVLWEVDRLDLTIVGMNILITVLAMGLSCIAFEATESDISKANMWLLCLYVAIALIWKSTILSRGVESSQKKRALQSLQFVACVTAAYILVPIAFAHTSLSYVPSVLWTPILAFPNFGNRSIFGKLLDLFLLAATAPPLLLVPHVFETYTTFVQFAYIPLHVQMLLLVLTSLFS